MVGVNVGGAGVNVLVGEPTLVLGISGWMVCVNPATMVCATVVPIRLASGVEMKIVGEVHARAAINKTTTVIRTGVDFNMGTCFLLLNCEYHNTKRIGLPIIL